MRLDIRAENLEEQEPDLIDYVPEGVEAIVPYKGRRCKCDTTAGRRTQERLSYCGSRNLKDLRLNGEFMRITEVGLKESMPHDVKEL